MLLEKPILHKPAELALAELRAGGIPVTDADVIWLNAAAAQYVRAVPAQGEILMDLPMPSGKVLLWPLSIGARMWLRERRDWIPEKFNLEALAFAMAHSREPEIFRTLTTPWKCTWSIAKWAVGVGCSRRELDAAVCRCLDPEDYDLVEVETPVKVIPSAESGYGDVVAMLCHYYGETPDHWLWKESEARCAELLRGISQVLPAERRVDSNSPNFKAFSRLRLVLKAIRDRHTAQTHSSPRPGGK